MAARRAYDYKELVNRDKTSLEIFWLTDLFIARQVAIADFSSPVQWSSPDDGAGVNRGWVQKIYRDSANSGTGEIRRLIAGSVSETPGESCFETTSLYR